MQPTLDTFFDALDRVNAIAADIRANCPELTKTQAYFAAIRIVRAETEKE